MNIKFSVLTLFFSVSLLGGLAFQGSLQATHPEIDNGALHCAVDGNNVKLSWNIHFFAPIRAWIINRDGVDIAKLPPEAMSYLDTDVEDGEHIYTLSAINLLGTATGSLDPDTTAGETISGLGRCEVIVGDFGLRCRVDGNNVNLEWGPILIDVAISHFVIRRNGVVIATVPVGDGLKYTDTVPGPGTYRYTVHAELIPDHGFLIGACTVRIPSDRFICKVDPPIVFIDWSRVPLPEIVINHFVVIRDGVRIAATREFSYTDTPGPGEHHYKVIAIWGVLTPDDVLDFAGNVRQDELVASNSICVGECKIFMPGDGVPPPEELTCVDLDAPTDRALALDIFVRAHDVLLVWQKPVEYDWVAIARNDELIARIPGSQFYYVDENVPAGNYVYSVFGIVGDQVSPPAKCEISIPGIPLPPPTNLTCRFIGISDQLANSVSVDGVVLLNWTNGANYEWIVVVRNDQRLAKIPGNATSYSDQNPVAGHNTYAVFGVIGIRRSEAAKCEVKVPPARVPPPTDLHCAVIHPVPIPGPLPIDPNQPILFEDAAGLVLDDSLTFAPPGVILRWSNPVEYDKILIKRNGSIIATLPGTSQGYFDHLDGLFGVFRYEVIGVIADRLSAPAVCEVEIKPQITPPPRDFKCEAVFICVSPTDPLDPAVPGDVIGGVDNNGGNVIIEPKPIPRPDCVPIVLLSWVNPILYSHITIFRNGSLIAEVSGNTTFYRDFNPPSGIHIYTLHAFSFNGIPSQRVNCKVVVPPIIVPPVRGLTCIVVDTNAQGPTAILQWVNAANYDKILILRNDGELASLPGDSTEYLDLGLEPGMYKYNVIAIIDDRRSRAAECSVVVEGPLPPNLLYFSSGLFKPADDSLAAPIPLTGSGRVTCMLSNSNPIQGWSFGVCSDPSVLVVEEVSIAGTATAALNGGAGPSFLVINRFERGVVMAVVIDEMDTSNTLPPAFNHKILNLKYGGGPDAEPGATYPVNYCNTLGDPPVAVLYVVKGFAVEPDTRAGFVTIPEPVQPGFLRSDSNSDGLVNINDSVFTLWFLFLNGPSPTCIDAADANANSGLNLADPVYTLQFKYNGGPPPPAPFPDCGPAEFELGCEEPTCF